MKIQIIRSRFSLQPKRHPELPAAWGNSDGNNSLDRFYLFLDEGIAGHSAPLFTCKAQTIANLEGLDPGVHRADTIEPGTFQLRAFVDSRQFWCIPHGICNTRTLAGEWIGENSTTATNPNRWLMHDWQAHRDKPKGQDTRVAWSAGCIVVPDADLILFSAILTNNGIKPGDLIDGELIMEG
jgi:hypothetical protein